MEASHKELARDMFEKITDYLCGELAGSQLDSVWREIVVREVLVRGSVGVRGV